MNENSDKRQLPCSTIRLICSLGLTHMASIRRIARKAEVATNTVRKVLSRAADLLVVAVTSALIVSVPSTVPIQVFVDLAFTSPFIVILPSTAPIATSDIGMVVLATVIEPEA